MEVDRLGLKLLLVLFGLTVIMMTVDSMIVTGVNLYTTAVILFVVVLVGGVVYVAVRYG